MVCSLRALLVSIMSRKPLPHKAFRCIRVRACCDTLRIASRTRFAVADAKMRVPRKRPPYKVFRRIAVCIMHWHASRRREFSGRAVRSTVAPAFDAESLLLPSLDQRLEREPMARVRHAGSGAKARAGRKG